VHLLTSGRGVSAGDEAVAKSGVHDVGGERHEQDGRTLLLAQAKSLVHPPPLLQHHLLAEPHHAELHSDLVPLTERGVKH
jgi:hypothetical protein